MKYHICVTLDEYYEADIEAETPEEAEDKAIEKFEKQTKTYTIDCELILPKKKTYRLAK